MLKDKKHHYLYKTIHLESSRYYIGVHSTDDPRDGYLGSGIALLDMIKKYGRGSFKVRILEEFPERELAYEREAEVVTEELLEDPQCLNLSVGGHGGAKDMSAFTGENNPMHEKGYLVAGENNPMHGKTGTECPGSLLIGEKNPQYGKSPSEETRKKMSDAKKGKRRKPFSEEHRRKISESLRKRNQ